MITYASKKFNSYSGYAEVNIRLETKYFGFIDEQLCSLVMCLCCIAFFLLDDWQH